MKLKNILLLSFVSVIISLFLVTGVAQFIIMGNATDKHIKLAKRCEDQLLDDDLEQPFATLLPYYRDYVCMDTELTALNVARVIEANEINSLSDLLNHKEVLHPGSKYFLPNEKRAVERMLISEDQLMYVSPVADPVELNEIKNRHPLLGSLVECAQETGESCGDFNCYDAELKEYRPKFVSIVKVENQPYLVASAVFMPQILNPLLADLHKKQKEKFLTLQKDMDDSFDVILLKMILFGLVISGVLSFLAVLLSYRLASFIAKPVEQLQAVVEQVGEGNFEIHVEEKGSRESIALAHGFNLLGQKLTRYVEQLEIEMHSREAVESEIRLVAQIQADALPKMTADFQRSDFSLVAELVPAREAAGDFYDFRFMSQNRLVMLVADIAGKDLSAAFFMMKAKTLLNVAFDHHPEDPARALSRINDVLARGNSECMFLTVFLAYCDLDTGLVTYANAGHHDTICMRSNHSPTPFGVFRNPPLGFVSGVDYQRGEYQLDPGDMLLMYTDGITEAQGEKEEDHFGDERLLDLCAENSTEEPEILCERILMAVRQYETDVQSDDLTLLAFKWSPMPELVAQAETGRNS